MDLMPSLDLVDTALGVDLVMIYIVRHHLFPPSVDPVHSAGDRLHYSTATAYPPAPIKKQTSREIARGTIRARARAGAIGGVDKFFFNIRLFSEVFAKSFNIAKVFVENFSF